MSSKFSVQEIIDGLSPWSEWKKEDSENWVSTRSFQGKPLVWAQCPEEEKPNDPFGFYFFGELFFVHDQLSENEQRLFVEAETHEECLKEIQSSLDRILKNAAFCERKR